MVLQPVDIVRGVGLVLFRQISLPHGIDDVDCPLGLYLFNKLFIGVADKIYILRWIVEYFVMDGVGFNSRSKTLEFLSLDSLPLTLAQIHL